MRPKSTANLRHDFNFVSGFGLDYQMEYPGLFNKQKSSYLDKRHEQAQAKALKLRKQRTESEVKELRNKPKINPRSTKIAEAKSQSGDVFSRLTSKSHNRKKQEELKRIEKRHSKQYKPKINDASKKINRSLRDLYPNCTQSNRQAIAHEIEDTPQKPPVKITLPQPKKDLYYTSNWSQESIDVRKLLNVHYSCKSDQYSLEQNSLAFVKESSQRKKREMTPKVSEISTTRYSDVQSLKDLVSNLPSSRGLARESEGEIDGSEQLFGLRLSYTDLMKLDESSRTFLMNRMNSNSVKY